MKRRTSSSIPSSSLFQTLPQDLQIQILILLPIPDLEQFCSTSPQVQSICKNENLWMHKFAELSSSPVGSHKVPIELAATWFHRTRILWQMLHPKKLYQLIKDEADYPISTISSYTGKKTNVKKCIVEDYQSDYRVRSSINRYINDIIHKLINRQNPVGNINRKLYEVLQKQTISDVQDLDELINYGYNDDDSGQDVKISFHSSWLIDTDSSGTDLAFSVYNYDFDKYESVMFSMRAENRFIAYALMAMLLNYTYLFPQTQTLNNIRLFRNRLFEEANRNHETFVEPSIYTTNDVMKVFSIQDGDDARLTVMKTLIQEC